MNFDNLKDPLIVAALFFIAASDWFDNWLKDMFPSLRTTNPMVFTLIKTLFFAGLYWLYRAFMERRNSGNGNNANPPANAGANAGN